MLWFLVSCVNPESFLDHISYKWCSTFFFFSIASLQPESFAVLSSVGVLFSCSYIESLV